MTPAIDSQITFLYTRDLQRCARFYEDIIGLTLWRDQGTCRIYQVAGSAYVGFCQRDETKPGAEQQIIFTLVTEDVDGWYRALVTRGVHFEKAPAVNPKYHIYHCFLRDPDGYLIEIQRFLP
ncbi:MAG: VOC family protein [Chloroflexi bacterium]|nr:VOC family protein [Chloroflexota bacterium]